jgi:hypothetical protein
LQPVFYFSILSFAIFFGNARAASFLEQEKGVGITDHIICKYLTFENVL